MMVDAEELQTTKKPEAGRRKRGRCGDPYPHHCVFDLPFQITPPRVKSTKLSDLTRTPKNENPPHPHGLISPPTA